MMNAITIPIQTEEPRKFPAMTMEAACALAKYASQHSNGMPACVVSRGSDYGAMALSDVKEGERVVLLYVKGEMLR